MSFFLPYQQKWIQDASQLKIMEKSRQIGLSWCSAYACVRRQSKTDKQLDTWVSSRDELQARLFIQDCANFAKSLDIAARALAEPLLQSKQSSSLSLEFDNRSCIHSLSSNPDAQAGKRGHRVLDEFALHPSPRLLYTIAYPGITWGGQLEIISTHRGADNFFNELLKEIKADNPKQFSHHRVTLQDALNQGFLQKLQSRLEPEDPRMDMDEAAYFDSIKNACCDAESFQQEYMCTPASDETAFLGWSLIEACQYKPEQNWELQNSELTGPLYIGVDIARERDFTVFWLLEQIEDVAYTRKVIRLQKVPFAEQEAQLNELLELPRVRRVCIDQTGIGRQFAERAQSRYGKDRIEGVCFTLQSKEALAWPVRSTMESRGVRIPQSESVRSELRSVRKENTAAGNIRFSANRTRHGHADSFWALALALHAARRAPQIPTHYESIQRPLK